jgi:hypothetical protein
MTKSEGMNAVASAVVSGQRASGVFATSPANALRTARPTAFGLRHSTFVLRHFTVRVD